MTPPTPEGDLTRERLLALVRERRGVHKSGLARLAGRGWGTMSHHIPFLIEDGHIETEVHGRLLWIFARDVPQRERELIIALRGSAAQRLLEALGMKQRATIRMLSDELAVSKKVIRTHLSHLQRAGAVEKTEGNPPTFATALRK